MSNIAVLGAAHPHVIHLASEARKIECATLIGIYDDDPDVRASVASELDMPAFDRLADLLALRPDLVLIGAVPSQRVELAERAMAGGASALIDKPLALDRESLDRLRAAQERYRRPAIAFYPLRGHPLIVAAKRAVDDGRVGRLVRILGSGPHRLASMDPRPDWHWKRSANGDVLIDIGSHYFDLCCWLTGQEPSDLTARFGNFANPEHPEFRDFGCAQMRFPDGTLAYVEVDWLIGREASTSADARIWIQGTRGKIDLHFGPTSTGRIWTGGYFEPLSPAEPSSEQWTIDLMRNLLLNRPHAIPQEEVWRASEVSLRASEAARAEEERR